MDQFMKIALDEARFGMAEGGIPIGSALVHDGKLIAKGRNRRIQDSNPIMHGEMTCLSNAGKLVDSFRGMTLYSTLMPCHMCAGTAVQFGIKTVIVGESETFEEGRNIMESHGIEVIDLNLDEAKAVLNEFIEATPELWSGDIGKI